MVAAVRVLEHQLKRAPTVDELGGLLDYAREYAGHLVRALESQGILHAIHGPFDTRVEIRDHTKIEELPEEDRGPGFKDEVDDFHRKFEEKQKKLQNLFDSDEAQQRQRKRFENLDEELKDFKSPRHANPFRDDPEPSS
jgi:hypothetical protein